MKIAPFSLRSFTPLLCCTLSALTAVSASEAVFAKGAQPVPAGAKVTLEPEKTTYYLGENIIAHFCVQNAGQQPFQIDTGGDYRGASRHLRFKITATDGKGVVAKDPDPNPICFGGLGTSPILKPGEKWYQTLSLNPYCRFEAPGLYTIRAQHDLGWKATPENPLPVAQTQITLEMPSPEQAKKLLAVAEALPENGGVLMGQKDTQPYRDFSTFSYPVYLPFLIERVKAGKLEFLDSIADIHTPEATRALVALLKSEPQTAHRAADILTRRSLAKPQPNGAPPPDAQDDSTAIVRAYASQAVLSDDRETLRTAATLLGNAGTEQELPVVLQALEKRLQATVKTPRWQAIGEVDDDMEGWQLQDDCLQLMSCAAAIVKRGATLPTETSPATVATQIQAIIDTNQPGKWTQDEPKWLNSPMPFIRQLALQSLKPTFTQPPVKPFVLAPEVRALLPKLLHDSDASVKAAACDLAGASQDRTLLPDVLQVVASANNHWVIGSANEAAKRLGGNYQVWQIWASRMDEKGLLYQALLTLSEVVDSHRGHSWDSSASDANEGARLKLKWLKFLQDNKTRLQQGHLLTEQEFNAIPGLFPKGFQFS